MRTTLRLVAIALSSIAIVAGLTPVANATPPCYVVSGTVITGYGTCSGAVVIQPGITEIGVTAFRNSGVTSIDIPASVRTIADAAFYRLDSLTAVTFHEGLLTIGEGAFSETHITSIVIPNSVTSIGQSAFYGNHFATNLVIGTGISEITNDVFVGIQATTITIPSNVKSIGTRAFLDADTVVSINLSEGLEVIDEDAFTGTSAVNIIIPSTVYSLVTTTQYGNGYEYAPEVLTRVAATAAAREIRLETARKAAAIYESARAALEMRMAARSRALEALNSGKVPTSDDLLHADFNGITAANVLSLQSEIVLAKATTIEAIEKLALKVVVVEKLSGDSASIFAISKRDLAAIGIVGMDGAYKATILRSLALADPSDRDTYAGIQAIAKKTLDQISARKLRLSTVIAKIKNTK